MTLSASSGGSAVWRVGILIIDFYHDYATCERDKLNYLQGRIINRQKKKSMIFQLIEAFWNGIYLVTEIWIRQIFSETYMKQLQSNGAGREGTKLHCSEPINKHWIRNLWNRKKKKILIVVVAAGALAWLGKWHWRYKINCESDAAQLHKHPRRIRRNEKKNDLRLYLWVQTLSSWHSARLATHRKSAVF